MDEFPDPEDEYDLLHEDEMDVLREMEDMNPIPKSAPARQDLNFHNHNVESLGIDIAEDDEEDDEGNLVIDLPTEACHSGKRQLSVESLNELDAGVSYIEPPSKKHKCEAQTIGEFDFNLHCGVTSLRLPNWPFLTFNTCDGERFYVRFKEDDTEQDVNQYTVKAHRSGLLSDSFKNLKELAEKSLKDSLERSRENVEDDSVVLDEEGSDLWVEKFKPRRYLELLSDEGVNRSLLNWLKKWDKLVFNKSTQQISPKSEIKHEKSKKFHNNSFKSNIENVESLDADGRPHYKIALLCGPPGLGKTTLAHVIASLAGYNVIEVNASDDRSIDAFHAKLEAATQMQSVMGSNKPNCLILDEIDGAPTSSVEYLLKYINGKTSQKGGKKEKTKGVVKRPVICICNEPYMPSLRQLRQQAYVVHFPQTSSSRLAQRLLEICRKQGIKTDLSTLTLLCDKMQSDIRCCISTLHFFKCRNGHTFKPTDVAKCNVGQKDVQKGLFSMWQEIFQISMKKNRFLNSNTKNCDDIASAHFHYSSKNMERLRYLVQLFQSCGDFERLQQGIFENFLKMKFPRTIPAIVSGLDWFCWADIMDTYIKENQNYALLPYLPYSFAAWHFLFSSPGYIKITFPKTGYENHLKEVRTKQILSDVLRGLNPGIRANTHGDQLVLDILPMFKTILVPSLRPVNLKLFNEREKKDFGHLLDVMIDYNLNYIQQRSPDGTYYYQFDPNIEEITQFSEMERNKLSFSYNMKQFISREVEMERVRRTEVHVPESERKENTTEGVRKDVSNVATGKVPNHLVKLTPKEVNIDNNNGAQYKDFFGRVVTAKASDISKGTGQRNNSYKSKVWFTYKEGFNNAVKKDVTIEYLL